MVHGDTGYRGTARWCETTGVVWMLGMQPGKRCLPAPGSAEAVAERAKASVRAKVEQPFRVIKRQFGHVKVRYRGAGKELLATGDAVRALEPLDGTVHAAGGVGRRMPASAPDATHPGQEGLREAGSRMKTGLDEPYGQRFPVTCLARDPIRALRSLSLGFHGRGTARSRRWQPSPA